MVLLSVVAWACRLAAADASDVVISAPVQGRGLAADVGLPPQAEVNTREDVEDAWQVEGRIAGTTATVVFDFMQCLVGHGWRRDKTIVLCNRPGNESKLVLWQKGERTMLLHIWETTPGECGFRLGIETHGRRKGGGR